MNNVEVKKTMSGSVNLKDKYVMIEKLKDKNKNAQWFVLFSIVYHKSIKALCVNCRSSSSVYKGKNCNSCSKANLAVGFGLNCVLALAYIQ